MLLEDDNNNEKICRICHSEESDTNPLFYPCKCKGSIKYTHQACILQWLKTSGRKNCEVCGYDISLIPVYKKNTPNDVPLSDFFSMINDHLTKYLKVYVFVFLFTYFCVILSPIYIYRSLTSVLYLMISNSNETRIPLLQPITYNTVAEFMYGLLILIITLLLMYLFYRLSCTLGKLEQPWWIENDSPFLPFNRVQQSTFEESSFPFPRALTDTISDLSGYGAGAGNNGDDTEENVGEEDTQTETDGVEEDYPALTQRIRSLIYNGHLENVFYIFVAAILIILATTIVVLGFSGMPFIALNKYATCVSSGSLGIMLTNMLFYYSFMCPFFYLVHAILKKRGLYYFAKIFLFVKFVLTLLIEYLLTPFLYGYVLYSSLKFARTHDLYASFCIFPITDHTFIYFTVLGFLNIFGIACILFHLNSKLRKGFLFPLNDNSDELKRFISETFYESFSCLLLKITKSYFKYLFFFLFLETFIPYWASFKVFDYINRQYSHLGYRKFMFEIYIMVHFLPYMSNRVPFKNILDNFVTLFLEKFGKILSLESFLFGTVPLKKDDEVWDRLGKHAYSPIHSPERSNVISSDPFIKPYHFKRNVYILVFGSFLLTSFLISLSFIFFSAIGSYFTILVFGMRTPSFNISFFYGFYIFWFLCNLTECLIRLYRKWQQTSFDLFKSLIFQAVVLVLIFLFALPIINGAAIDLITNMYKCLNGNTCLVFPIYNWFTGFMLVKFQLFTVNFLPANLINSYPILMSLRHGFQTQNYSVLVHEFAIPYIAKLTFFIAAPYVLTFGLGHFFNISIQMQYRIFYQIYFVIFSFGFTIYSFGQFKSLYKKIIRYTKDRKYLIGHEIQNLDQTPIQ